MRILTAICTAVAIRSVCLRCITRQRRRQDPPGSAGVSPACNAVAYLSVSLRIGTRPPRRQDPPGSAGVSPACTAAACHSVSLRLGTVNGHRKLQGFGHRKLQGFGHRKLQGLGHRKWQGRPAALRREPPGSAGVPPACTAVAIRSVCLRCITRQRRRQERREPGRSRAVA